MAALPIRRLGSSIASALLASGVVPAQEPEFTQGSTTLVVLPDTERYSDDHPEHFESQATWIAANRAQRNIAYVLHLGDVTQHNAPEEWEVAQRSFARFAEQVPYAIATGNHDYEGNAPRRATSLLSRFFDPRAFERWPTFGGLFERDRLENSYHLLRIGTQDWLVLVLEMGPRDEVVAWANAVLERHADRNAIVLTHAYLFRGDVRYDHRVGAQRASPHGWGNDGEQLWQKLVRRHANVHLVLSGHVSTGGLGYLASRGEHGNVVHQMMVDYEKLPEGGQGYLRLLEFEPDGRTVRVRTYSPSLQQSRTSAREDFTFQLTEAQEPSGRTQDEPTHAAPEPIHRYPFDGEGAHGATIRDAIGDAHGTLEAGESESALDGRGNLTLAGQGHVRLPRGLLANREQLSFEFWFTPTAERYRWNAVVRFGGADDWLTYVFRTLDVHRAEITIGRQNDDVQRKLPVRTGRTMHTVLTYARENEREARLSSFHDGKLVGTMLTQHRLADVDEEANVLGPIDGVLHEFRIYDRALDEEQVRASFAAGPDRLPVATNPSAPASESPSSERVGILFDTDMDTDCDDAGALAMLHTLATRGEVEILATVVSSHYPYSGPCVRAINAWYGREEIPIGVPKGEGASTSRGSRYAETLAREYPSRFRDHGDLPDAVTVYRRLLASRPDGSVVIVTVGYLTNLRHLLATGPDVYSELTGTELVARKVRRWVCMGGRYPAETNTGVHGNFKPDPSSAIIAVRDWPGVIYFSGNGREVQTGERVRAMLPAEHPVRRIYELYLGDRPTRPSWDQVALLYAVRPDASFWRLREAGSNLIHANGTNEWRDAANDPRHRLVEVPPEARLALARTIEDLMVGR